MVYDACRAALAQGYSLFDVLQANPIIAAALPTDKLRALCDPANYLGSAPAMVDEQGAPRAKAFSIGARRLTRARPDASR